MRNRLKSDLYLFTFEVLLVGFFFFFSNLYCITTVNKSIEDVFYIHFHYLISLQPPLQLRLSFFQMLFIDPAMIHTPSNRQRWAGNLGEKQFKADISASWGDNNYVHLRWMVELSPAGVYRSQDSRTGVLYETAWGRAELTLWIVI